MVMQTSRKNLEILVVEDHQLIRELLVQSCGNTWPHARVVGVTTGAEAVSYADSHQPDIVLLDLCLPDCDGLDIAMKILEVAYATKVIAITSHADEFTIHRAMRGRLHGFVDKNEQPLDVIRQAVETVLDGRQYLSETARRIWSDMRFDPVNFSKVLSDREISLLSLLGRGLTNEEIAAQVGLAVSTVKLHRNKIMMRIGVHSTPQLMRYALSKGFINREDAVAHAS